MKLSIIVPVYKVEATLDCCLESLVGQSFRDFELILVDDGSPDNCPAMCDAWAERDSRISVIHKKNGGLSDARNAGLETARGDYVTFVDSDDFVRTDTYASVMPTAEHCDIVEFPLYRFYGGTEQAVASFGEQTFTDMKHYWLQGYAYEHSYAWNKVYRRSLFDGVRFPVGKVFEDVAVLPQLLRKAHCVKTMTGGLYYYCVNDSGITRNATGNELAMLLSAHCDVMKRWTDDRYYMHVVNIQLDVCRLTGRPPSLPRRTVNPLARGLTLTQRLKALLTDTIGIKGLCKINQRLNRR